MPAQSKAQFRFMQALVHGGLKDKPEGLSKGKAQEFIDKTPSYKELPEKKENFSRIKSQWKRK